jgi:hypothetical protein
MAVADKTTMAAAMARNEVVRRHYSRMGFVSVGQEPALMELQKQVYSQLTNDDKMEAVNKPTVAKLREVLQQAVCGKTWLVIMDDIWQADHERSLNFIDEAAPESKVLVTTRLAKLLPGYVEVALGLLSEQEAVELLLGTAEIAVASETQVDAAKKIAKQTGSLPLYLTLVGRLIYEFDVAEAWETEIV